MPKGRGLISGRGGEEKGESAFPLEPDDQKRKKKAVRALSKEGEKKIVNPQRRRGGEDEGESLGNIVKGPGENAGHRYSLVRREKINGATGALASKGGKKRHAVFCILRKNGENTALNC